MTNFPDFIKLYGIMRNYINNTARLEVIHHDAPITVLEDYAQQVLQENNLPLSTPVVYMSCVEMLNGALAYVDELMPGTDDMSMFLKTQLKAHHTSIWS